MKRIDTIRIIVRPDGGKKLYVKTNKKCTIDAQQRREKTTVQYFQSKINFKLLLHCFAQINK